MRARQSFDGVSMDAVRAVAELFGRSAERQPFDLPGDTDAVGVWQVIHRSESGNIRVLMWPAIDRIDVAVGPHMWVVKGIREVEVLDGLEVVARFGDRGVLTVALGGQVVLTTPHDVPSGS